MYFSTWLLLWLSGYPFKGARFIMRALFACEIGRRLPRSTRISHPLGIVIHSEAKFGERVTIQQHVTVGVKTWGGRTGAGGGCPCVEDDVTICCGAVIAGSVRVGKGAVIGANAVVTKDVPAGGVIVGANRLLRVMEDAAGTK